MYDRGVNPIALKIALATRGVRADDRLTPLLGPGPGNRVIELLLADDVHVMVPVDDAPGGTPYALVWDDDRIYVADGAELRFEVRVSAVPEFYERRTASGCSMWQVATVRGPHLLVAPAGTCGFSTLGKPCGFCREGARPVGQRERSASVADVVEVVRAAFDEGAADLVFFNSSVYEADDGGIDFLTPYIEAVRKHFDTFVAVQVHPPRTDAWIDRTYAMGVDAVSYNLELHDATALARHCIGRVRYIGRERYLEAIAYAASIFPAGAVWSDLVLGLEPAETTIAGIEALAALGAVPVLAVHHPGPDTIPQVTPDEAASVVEQLDRVVRERRLNPTWVRDLALGVTPLDACRMTGAAPSVGTAVQALTRWRLGAYAARGMARFRRRLRVKAIRDSLDASHL